MSEYQYYEFQALDRPLTTVEKDEMRKLSSRVVLTSTSAAFVYHYGDFRGNPESVLEKYFDAMLYITNWGTRQLMFRFPRKLVKIEALRPYCVEDVITVNTTVNHVTLNINITEEDAEWIEGDEGWLGRLIPLRQAILQGDYRSLYLAWLRACDLEFVTSTGEDYDDEEEEEDYEEDDSAYDPAFLELNHVEPPVPPNLKKLDGALQAFTEFFKIDPLWVAAGAAASTEVARVKEPLEDWVAALSVEECRRLLLRVAQDETNSGLYVRNELRQRFASQVPGASTGKRRTIAELLAQVEEITRKAKEEAQRQKELERQQRLQTLAQQEPSLWRQVTASIQLKNARGYDDAIGILKDLRTLAQSRGEQASFQQRVEQLQAQFPTLSSFKSRLVEARLIKG